MNKNLIEELVDNLRRLGLRYRSARPREAPAGAVASKPARVPERILLAMDCGDTAVDAWREASFLARTFGAEITLAHALDDANDSGDWRRKPSQDLEANDVEELSRVLQNLSESDGVRVSPNLVVRPGRPADVVLALAHETDVDMIVLGAGRKGTLERVLLGSTAERVIREARVPVWLVRPGAAHKEVKRILCAVDRSEPAHGALALAALLSRTFVCRLGLLSVVPAGQEEQAQDLANLVADFDLHGIEVETLVRSGEIAPTISEAAQDFGCDVLVIGSARRRGLPRLLAGANTAERLVRRVPCTLLTVPGVRRASSD